MDLVAARLTGPPSAAPRRLLPAPVPPSLMPLPTCPCLCCHGAGARSWATRRCLASMNHDLRSAPRRHRQRPAFLQHALNERSWQTSSVRTFFFPPTGPCFCIALDGSATPDLGPLPDLGIDRNRATAANCWPFHRWSAVLLACFPKGRAARATAAVHGLYPT